MDGFKVQGQDFILNALCDGEPVELLENGCDVVYGRSVCDNAGGRALDQLKLTESFFFC